MSKRKVSSSVSSNANFLDVIALMDDAIAHPAYDDRVRNVLLVRHYLKSGMAVVIDVNNTEEFSIQDQQHLQSHVGVYEEHRMSTHKCWVDFDMYLVYCGY